ncbi:hypothetical protein [Roseateles violae]|uniref:YfhG lipoprotein n=1 Tax=Roseateles violae TaxID=3058042 RepID=A0ABT8DJP7_9BURK|nr:hypothetical protein [Pelomonas sp. PFR6]MDN3918654.1 hypothetical protein [Pelomonas sp. PFR6]
MLPSPDRHRLAGLCCALLVGACAAPPPAPPPPPPEIVEVRVEVPVPVVLPEDEAARQMLALHERLRRMDAAELAQQLPPPGDDAALSPQQATQAALALALGPARSNGELGRAQALVDQVLRSTAPEAQPWQPWALLVGARLAEQRRLEAQIERLAQQGRDSQRRLEQLGEKLEALKAIERSLSKRPASAP